MRKEESSSSFKKGTKKLLLLGSAVPFLGMLGGIGFVNHAAPFVLGLPLPLAWITIWVVLTFAVMAAIYALDPANRAAPGVDPSSAPRQ